MSQGNGHSEEPQQPSEPTEERDAAVVLAPAPPWAPATKVVVGVGLAIAALLVVWLSRGVLGTLALSGLIAFLLAPLVRFLHQRARVPRGVALIATYVAKWVGTSVMGFDRSPISPILTTVILGLLLRNLIGLPQRYRDGLIWCAKRILRVGVALLGLGLSLLAIGFAAATPIGAASIGLIHLFVK